jgi:phosphatidate cytidylyltransferase
MAGKDATVVSNLGLSSITVRLLSAVVMIPPVLAAVYFGSPYFAILLVAISGALAWEWTLLCSKRYFKQHYEAQSVLFQRLFFAAALLGGVFAAMFGHYIAALGILGAGGALIALSSFFTSKNSGHQKPFLLWLASGTAYIGFPVVALFWLYTSEVQGKDVVFWLLGVVWASDTGAYAFGSLIGGPKLAPQISPNKTWAGLGGGIACAALVGDLAGVAFEKVDGGLLFVLLSGFLGFVAQSGDLAESWVKRHFGVKDASSIIPGHGGVLDRVDGLLASTLAVALIALTTKGSILVWP